MATRTSKSNSQTNQHKSYAAGLLGQLLAALTLALLVATGCWLACTARVVSAARVQKSLLPRVDQNTTPPAHKMVEESQHPGPRMISGAEVKQHDGKSGNSFWAVVDGFVVDASDFVEKHPGGKYKILSTNSAEAGATSEEFSFSFTRGPNAHFPQTGRQFREGTERYLNGKALSSASECDGTCFLEPVDVVFGDHGRVTILGKLLE